jgi:capsular polysaccharide transport system permease protein
MLDVRDKSNTKIEARTDRGYGGLIESFQQWLPLAKKQNPVERPQLRRAPRGRKLLVLLVLLLPTIAAGVYFTFIASDRYVSEASFVVRTASRASGSGGLTAVLQMAGFSRSDDDVFSVQDFITSREAFEQLSKKLALRDIYSRPGADFLMRYPSFVFGRTDEEFFHYLKMMIAVTYNSTTGITTLAVQAFRPEDAHAIATTLLDLAEQKVNELNERIRGDAVRVATDEVKMSEGRLSDSTVKMTAFQTRELMIDPAKNSVMLSDLIGKLGTDLATTQSTAAEMASSSPNDPGLSVLNDRARALKNQIQAERDQIAGDSKGLADQLAVYEQLSMERKFAADALDRALLALDNARVEATRQQLFLEPVVSPNQPDYATMPLRIWNFSTIAIVNLLGLMILWLFRTGIREHAQST